MCCDLAFEGHGKKSISENEGGRGDQTKLSELVQYCSQASKMRYRKYK